MSSAGERGEREAYSKIHKKPRRDAAANPKTLQHGPGIWPSAAAAAVAVARATPRQLQCPGVVPSPAQAGQLALALALGCAANQHKKLWVSCEFCAKVRFASFSNLILSSRCPVCYLPAFLLTCCSRPSAQHFFTACFTFAFCYLRKFMR